MYMRITIYNERFVPRSFSEVLDEQMGDEIGFVRIRREILSYFYFGPVYAFVATDQANAFSRSERSIYLTQRFREPANLGQRKPQGGRVCIEPDRRKLISSELIERQFVAI